MDIYLTMPPVIKSQSKKTLKDLGEGREGCNELRRSHIISTIYLNHVGGHREAPARLVFRF